MKRFILAAFAVTIWAVPASADPKCRCVANGIRADVGQVICLKIGSGPEYLARCERVLNNTSWKRLKEGCPTAARQSLPQKPFTIAQL